MGGLPSEILTKEKQRVGRAFQDSIQLGGSTSSSGPGLSALRRDVKAASRGGERVGLKTPEIHSTEVREGGKLLLCNIRNVAEKPGVRAGR